MNTQYYIKYLKYKNKYLNIKNIQQTGGNQSKVLILCHPKKVTGTFNPLKLNNHWYGIPELIEIGDKSVFESMFETYNLNEYFQGEGEPIFDTVDIDSGGTYRADAFSNYFIDAHKNEYDLIMVPDCTGLWHDGQATTQYKGFEKVRDLTTEEIKKNVDDLNNYCMKLPKMLKQRGIIQIGKIFLDVFKEELIKGFERQGFTCEIRKTKATGEYIIAKR
jgi:hypothetical protein